MRKLNWEILYTSPPTPSLSGCLGWLWTVAASGTAAVAAAAGPGHRGGVHQAEHPPPSCAHIMWLYMMTMMTMMMTMMKTMMMTMMTIRPSGWLTPPGRNPPPCHVPTSCEQLFPTSTVAPQKVTRWKEERNAILFVTKWITIFVYGLILLNWILFEW